MLCFGMVDIIAKSEKNRAFMIKNEKNKPNIKVCVSININGFLTRNTVNFQPARLYVTTPDQLVMVAFGAQQIPPILTGSSHRHQSP